MKRVSVPVGVEEVCASKLQQQRGVGLLFGAACACHLSAMMMVVVWIHSLRVPYLFFSLLTQYG